MPGPSICCIGLCVNFMQILYCFDYYSFVIKFEITKCDTSSSYVLLSQDCFGHLWSLSFYTSRILCSSPVFKVPLELSSRLHWFCRLLCLVQQCMWMVHLSTCLCLLQFLSLMSYRFQCTCLSSPSLNLFLGIFSLCYNCKWGCFLSFFSPDSSLLVCRNATVFVYWFSHDPDNHDRVVTRLEPDILECEVKDLRKHCYEQSWQRWWNSSWAIENPKSCWC